MTQPSLSSQEYIVKDTLEAVEMYFAKGWTDGLPIVPPTTKRVQQFIDHVGRSPGEVLGRIPVRRYTVTVEKVAINAVMAGCLPEYMPVVLAAVEAMCGPEYNLHGSSASTGGAATLLIVNGPIAKELGINSGTNLFGPGCRANATIGRALRLILMNICGAIPGILDRTTIGHPGKFTYCIAEYEEDLSWKPYHVEKGFPANTSTVTALTMLGPHQVKNDDSNDASSLLTSLAGTIAAMGNYSLKTKHGLRYCVVIINSEHRAVIAREGWNKQQIKEFLYQKSQRSVADLKHWGMLQGDVEKGDEQIIIAGVASPDNIIVITAGVGGIFSACIAPWSAGNSSLPVTRPVIMPHSRK